MKSHCKDIFIAVLLMVGVAAFVNGDFILSSVLFAVAAITSNVYRKGLEPTHLIKKPKT